MSTDLERLKAWMNANEMDSSALQRMMGMTFALHKYIDFKDPWPIHDGIRYRFLDTFGDAAFQGVFGRESKERLAKYAAQQAVLKAVSNGELQPVKTRKCHGCNKQAQHYHHESYAPQDRLCVVPLCSKCHRLHHTGRKRLTFGVVPTAVGLVRIAIATPQA